MLQWRREHVISVSDGVLDGKQINFTRQLIYGGGACITP
jgi:hypothetical protein